MRLHQTMLTSTLRAPSHRRPCLRSLTVSPSKLHNARSVNYGAHRIGLDESSNSSTELNELVFLIATPQVPQDYNAESCGTGQCSRSI